MTPEERLAELLDAKDEELLQLKDELESAKRELAWGTGWLRHLLIEDDVRLPVPRLEIVYRPMESNNGSQSDGWVAVYRLVKRHLAEDSKLVAIPFGETTMSGYGSKIPTAPFRESAHLAFDSGHLGLPAFLCLPGQEPQPFELTDYPQVGRGVKARRA